MYPSIISTFNIVTPSDRLNSPSHSALHNSVSSVLTQVQTVIGTDSSVLGTIIGDLRNPNSGGGGHIQTANKGGTGQTTYAKGDLLVATSSSVISKLGVSSTSGDVLVADPNQSTGMKWGPVISNKVNISNSVVSLTTGAFSVLSTLFATSILGSTLGTNNGIKFTATIPQFNTGVSANNFILKVNYGPNSIASINIPNTRSVLSLRGNVEGMIIGNTTTTSQLGFVKINLVSNGINNTSESNTTLQVVQGYSYGTSSVDSSANQNLIIQGNMDTTDTKASILTGFMVVEKIS